MDRSPQHGGDDGRNESQLYFRIPDLSTLGGEDQVGRGRNTGSAAQGATLHRSNDGLRKAAHGYIQVAQSARGSERYLRVLSALQHFTQIEARAKIFPGSADEEDTNGGVPCRLLKSLAQGGHHLSVDGVALLGPV